MKEQYLELVEWLNDKKKMIQAIPETLDLIDNDILNSLLFAEYIMMIGDLSGVEIEVNDDLLEQVRTLALVKSNYFVSA
ncbi:MAG: hypothetical protein JKY19_10350 [Alcanivoracaceae bacterium]|nr:hypothetical protein [Alcanivoracaceae bacterium]